MAFTVNEFRSALRGDGARPNLFNVAMTLPTQIANAASASQQITFMARAAQLPGSTVNSVPVMYFGRELKFAGNRTFPEWTVTVINDEDFNIRRVMETWMNELNSHQQNLRAGDFYQASNYQIDGFITQYGKRGEAIKDYTFVGMFPIDISPIELDWGANDQIEEYAITFAYQWWESDTTT
jgi:hypothetical protein